MAELTHKFESNFSFLENSFAMLHSLGTSAEYNIYSDSVVSLFKIRQFGECVTEILFDEHALEFPYQNNQHNRLKELEFEHILPNIVKDLLFTIKNNMEPIIFIFGRHTNFMKKPKSLVNFLFIS